MKDKAGWRLAKKGEKDQVTVAMVACIPYERIEKIDWWGDTFYSNSRIYWHFEGRHGTTYDEIDLPSPTSRDGRIFASKRKEEVVT